mmetsp:Transcript_10623/g.16002  ORF Transcript_10623/g.16002 Transcript_10623/m.16002 type:complete len:419 (-) Transcript_10623:4552-5808(-)
MLLRSSALIIFVANGSNAFVVPNRANVQAPVATPGTHQHPSATRLFESSESESTTVLDVDEITEKRRRAKAALLGLIGDDSESMKNAAVDPILADPITKEPLKISTMGTILGGQSSNNKGMKVSLMSTDNTYTGRTNTYYNLLREQENNEEEGTDSNDDSGGDTSNSAVSDVLNSIQVFIPPPLRPVLSASGVLPGYIPMRDLFTSPSVSFAYERGWRQGFASAGFPGADKEYEMVREFFLPLKPQTVVDMSCATGLFTRRLAKGNDFARVIGCDYSEAMLLEARNRILSDNDLSSGSIRTKLDLVRCDVGEIPMQSDAVDALHAGAAMHCWPDLDSAMSEIHRVLKPGGRFFASTFLAPYFRTVQAASGDGIEQQAFQYFEDVDVLREIVMKGGFKDEDIEIEVLGSACAIIKASKS